DHPVLVGRPELARRIEAAESHFDLVAGAREHRGAARRAEVPALVVRGSAADRDRIHREDRGGAEHRAVVLAAIEAVAHTYAIRRAGGREAHRAAQAAAGHFFSTARRPSMAARYA